MSVALLFGVESMPPAVPRVQRPANVGIRATGKRKRKRNQAQGSMSESDAAQDSDASSNDNQPTRAGSSWQHGDDDEYIGSSQAIDASPGPSRRSRRLAN
ncbi:uncharacterized protein SPSC_05922 [Sporisorium scitamineum]|uniref:Uncharacterized protein n=1 Tax=Sporisorium scitamineum TaxID=49012 RepID=A0A127ZI00_9BASI|nr:uncharacterized protein SPSC_05922 [Sporisorium scitamineum]